MALTVLKAPPIQNEVIFRSCPMSPVTDGNKDTMKTFPCPHTREVKYITRL